MFWSEKKLAKYLRGLGYEFEDENEMYDIAFKLDFQWNEEDENYVDLRHNK